jgi:DnaJ-domain-containing protein 1
MQSPNLTEAGEASVDALVASTRASLKGGRRLSALVASLTRRGWDRELAHYFVSEVDASLRLERRRRAMKAAAVGLVWLGIGLSGVAGAYLLTGDWSDHGLSLLAWLFIAYGGLRVIAGAITAITGQPVSPVRPRAPYAGSAALADRETLGVAANATPEQVRAAYRELVRLWHPDHFAGAPELRDRAERRLKAINTAYTRLQKTWEQASSGG